VEHGSELCERAILWPERVKVDGRSGNKKRATSVALFTEKQLQNRLALHQAYYKPLKKASRSSSEIDFRSLNACTAPLALVMMRIS
jgi:hypothetical protein